MQLGAVTLPSPWGGHSPPTLDVKDIHVEAYWEGFFAHVVAPLFGVLTENVGWMVFAITLILVPAFGVAMWHLFRPGGDVYGRARDAQYSAEIQETKD